MHRVHTHTGVPVVRLPEHRCLGSQRRMIIRLPIACLDKHMTRAHGCTLGSSTYQVYMTSQTSCWLSCVPHTSQISGGPTNVVLLEGLVPASHMCVEEERREVGAVCFSLHFLLDCYTLSQSRAQQLGVITGWAVTRVTCPKVPVKGLSGLVAALEWNRVMMGWQSRSQHGDWSLGLRGWKWLGYASGQGHEFCEAAIGLESGLEGRCWVAAAC